MVQRAVPCFIITRRCLGHLALKDWVMMLWVCTRVAEDDGSSQNRLRPTVYLTDVSAARREYSLVVFVRKDFFFFSTNLQQRKKQKLFFFLVYV